MTLSASSRAPTQAFIDGEWRDSQSSFPVVNPFSREQLTEVVDCGPAEARQALDASVMAFRSWRQTTTFERSTVLKRWHELILQNADDIAVTMTLEMGKTIRESRGEVTGPTAGFVEWYAEEAKRAYGDVIPSQSASKRLFAVKQPVGPVYGITPWNFPASMVTRKAAPALAAGCTIVLKPAEQSPLTALFLAKLWQEAGGPPGTLQVLPSSSPEELSRVFLEDPRIRKASFTGSTAVGKRIYQAAASTVKRVSLELGGHAPFLVLKDADVGRAVEQAMIAKFRNIGQSCVAANRIFVSNEIAEEFAERFADAAEALVTGNPLDESTDIGPLVSEAALRKVTEQVDEARANGAKVVTGGEADGLIYSATVLTGLKGKQRILKEETFGPVAPIIPFDNVDEAVRQANETPYGLAAYLWTRDLGQAFRIMDDLDYGIIGINDGVPAAPQVPFGGVKESGIGKEGGKWGLDAFLEVKYASVGLP